VDVVGEMWTLSGKSGHCRGKVEQVMKNMLFAREMFLQSLVAVGLWPDWLQLHGGMLHCSCSLQVILQVDHWET
jgi:hypothetical protein